MHTFRCNLPAATALALFAAASLAAASGPALQSGAVTSALKTEGGAFSLEIKANPARIPLNEPFELTVDVKPARALDDPNPLWLGVSATMPVHAHGMNTRTEVEPLGAGRFKVKGLLFHMAGEWDVVLQVAKGRIHEQAHMRVLIE